MWVGGESKREQHLTKRRLSEHLGFGRPDSSQDRYHFSLTLRSGAGEREAWSPSNHGRRTWEVGPADGNSAASKGRA